MARSSRAIEAGRAFVRIFADSKALTRGLRAAQRKLKAFGGFVRNVGTRLAAAGAAAGAALGAAVGKFASFGDQLDKMSKRTGIGVKALSELKFAAEQNGSSLEDLSSAVLRMNRRLGRITAGQASKTQAEALETLGLSAQRLEQLSPEERLLAIADAMAAMEDPAEAAGLAQRAFGTQVDKILPLLLQGREGMQALRDEANALGITLSDEQAAAAAQFTDAWNRVKQVLAATVIQIGSSLAPSLTELLNRIAQASSQVVAWVKQNRSLIVIAGAATAAVTAFGVALVVAGALISSAASVLGLLIGVVSALFSPITLVIGGLAALGVAIFKSTKIGQQALGFLQEAFGRLAGESQTAFGAIKAAISAGDISAAMEVLTSFLILQWSKLKAFLLDTAFIGQVAAAFVGAWSGVKAFFGSIIQNLIGGLLEYRNVAVAVATGLLAAFQQAGSGILATMKQLFTTLGTAAKEFATLYVNLFKVVDGVVRDLLLGRDVTEGIKRRMGELVDDTARELGKLADVAGSEAGKVGTAFQDAFTKTLANQDDVDAPNAFAEFGEAFEKGRRDALTKIAGDTEDDLAAARADFEQAVDDAKQAGRRAADASAAETQADADGAGSTVAQLREAGATLGRQLVEASRLRSREGIEQVLRATTGIGRDRQQESLDALNGKVRESNKQLGRIERHTAGLETR